MLVPITFLHATFSCGSGCFGPLSPWSTHPSLHQLYWGRMVVNSLHYPLQGMPWGVSLSHEVGTLGVWPPPSLTFPIHAALGGALPTSDGMDSDSLETRWGMGWSGYTILDLWQCLSEVAMACHQPSASRRRMMTK